MTISQPPQPIAGKVLSLEEYIEQFSQRYATEPLFKDKVHSYLKLPRSRTWALSLGKNIAKGWYQKETQGIVRDYAEHVRSDVLDGLEAAKAASEAQQLEQKLATIETDLSQVADETQKREQDYQAVNEIVQEEQGSVENIIQDKLRKLESDYEERIRTITEGADAQKRVKEHLQQYLERSAYFTKDARGALAFADGEIVKIFEEMYLDDILRSIEADDGVGFVSRVKGAYTSIIERFDRIESVSEIPDVNWVKSYRLSRTKGYPYPTYPYLIAGKYSRQFKTTLDSAITVDTSTSMDDDGKHEIAKQSALSLRAMMRRVNPLNPTYFSTFDSELHARTPEEYFRMERAGGGSTRADLGLIWLFDTLNPSGWGLAHLLTDGDPTGPDNIMDRCVRAAARFRENPNILLRLYLINGSKNAEENIRLIGRAAGPDTKVIPIKQAQLGASMIRGVAESIGRMYSITDF